MSDMWAGAAADWGYRSNIRVPALDRLDCPPDGGAGNGGAGDQAAAEAPGAAAAAADATATGTAPATKAAASATTAGTKAIAAIMRRTNAIASTRRDRVMATQQGQVLGGYTVVLLG